MNGAVNPNTDVGKQNSKRRPIFTSTDLNARGRPQTTSGQDLTVANRTNPSKERVRLGLHIPAVTSADSLPIAFRVLRKVVFRAASLSRPPGALPQELVMNCSLRIGRVAGAELSAHWLFLLMIPGVSLASAIAERSVEGSMIGLLVAMALVASVLMREFGRLLVMEHYGSRTLSIILLPIGGIVHLKRPLADPKNGLKAAMVGPCLSLALSAVLLSAGSVLQELSFSPTLEAGVRRAAWANVGLAALHLVPVSPFDGGRALRSMLATRLAPSEAIEFTVAIGKASAIAIGMIGLVFHWALILAAVFVYVGADMEGRLPCGDAGNSEDANARRVMVTRFHVLSEDDTLQRAANEWRTSLQADFPVVDHGKVVAVLASGRLAEAMARTGPKERVKNVMDRAWPVIEDTDPLDAALQKFQAESRTSIPVTHEGRLVGVITARSINQWLETNSSSDRLNPSNLLARTLQVQGRPQQDWPSNDDEPDTLIGLQGQF